jgi:endogenous inhibitor of DNA gyrase (YacG/DUF329 family)
MPKKLTQKEYVDKAIIIHKNKYSYDKTVYTKAHDKVTITCPEHGEFTIKAYAHTNQKQGCPTCADNKVWDNDRFIHTANKVHNNFYDYSKVEYTNSHKKVNIICPNHGEFVQQPYVHLQGHHCPECGKESARDKAKNRPDAWTYSGWEEAGNMSPNFEGFSVYIIECYNANEKFIKIGKTFTSVLKRFRGNNIPYSWVLIDQIYGSSDYISKLEHELHSKFSNYSYVPEIVFPGHQECYTLNIKDTLEFNKATNRDSISCEQ